MAGAKKILVSVPHDLLEEIESITRLDNITRSQLIRLAMQNFIKEKKRLIVREQMQRGYIEMAAINLTLAEEGFYAEVHAEFRVEELLTVEDVKKISE